VAAEFAGRLTDETELSIAVPSPGGEGQGEGGRENYFICCGSPSRDEANRKVDPVRTNNYFRRMRTASNLKFVFGAAIFIAASTARAHFIHGTPDAPAHNLNHAAPVIGLAALAAVVGIAAYRCFKGK